MTRLVAPGDEDKMLDTRFPRLIDGKLDDRAIDDGQHFLGHGFGRGQKTGAKPATGKTAFLIAVFMGSFMR